MFNFGRPAIGPPACTMVALVGRVAPHFHQAKERPFRLDREGASMRLAVFFFRLLLFDASDMCSDQIHHLGCIKIMKPFEK